MLSYHGKDGLKNIALDIHQMAVALSEKLEKIGLKQLNPNFFDTLFVEIPETKFIESIKKEALNNQVNFRYFDDNKHIGISLDETTSIQDLNKIIEILTKSTGKQKVEDFYRKI